MSIMLIYTIILKDILSVVSQWDEKREGNIFIKSFNNMYLNISAYFNFHIYYILFIGVYWTYHHI